MGNNASQAPAPRSAATESVQDPPSSTAMASTEEQPVEDQFLDVSAKLFRWKIRRFSEMTETKYYSQAFSICGGTWRITLYPKGNGAADHLSIYLEAFDVVRKPRRWKQKVVCHFILVNQINRECSKMKVLNQEFSATRDKWGYQRFLALDEIRDASKGYKVDDTLIIQLKFDSELFGEELVTGNKFMWKITNFPMLTGPCYKSSIFELGGGSWELCIYPHGQEDCKTHLGLYLCVANPESLPEGWTINANFKLLVVNQNDNSKSVTIEIQWLFNDGRGYGSQSFVSLSKLHDNTGFIVNDTLIVEAEITFLEFKPLSIMFCSYFSRLEQYITDDSNPTRTAGSSLSSEDFEAAKQSLKEYLSASMFKSDMKEKLARDLFTLSMAKTGLTPDQLKTVKEFLANFREFTSDSFALEQDNAELELQQALSDQILGVVKLNLDSYNSLKARYDQLEREEEELKKQLQEAKSQEEEFTKEWEILLVQSQEEKEEYEAGEKKLVEAEEKKRIAEERMSRSTLAWSNLKQHFT